MPGAPAVVAPLARNGRPTWLLRELGPDFTLLVFGAAPEWARALPLHTLTIDGDGLSDPQGLARQRYDAQPGTAYLMRPDTHVAARWRCPSEAAVRDALDRACGWKAAGVPVSVAEATPC